MSDTAPILVDLFCKEGGSTRGYMDAGFYVVGVDIHEQPRYCGDDFIQYEALDLLDLILAGARGFEEFPLQRIDAIAASPPCQAYTKAQQIKQRTHPDLIAPTRERLLQIELPYVIENVKRAPLIDPVVLDGAMFDLGTVRERWFETNWPLEAPGHGGFLRWPPRARTAKMGRQPKEGELMHVVGNFSGVEAGRRAMGCDWMSRDGLREAVPPAMTEWIGSQLLAQIESKVLAS